MKKVRRLFLLSILIFAFAGCGVNEESRIKGILPTRIENIEEGGVIPEGHEAKIDSESVYTLDMLWGKWVLDTPQVEGTHISKQTISLGYDEDTIEVGCFPAEISFNPAWAGLGSGMGINPRYNAEQQLENKIANSALVFGEKLLDYEIQLADEPIGYAIENLGYGAGMVVFQEPEGADPLDTLSIIAFGTRKMMYDIHGNTLAIGVTEVGEFDESSETSIREIDYHMELNGYKLTLSYNGESAVYVPIQLNSDSWQGIELRNAGVTVNYKEVDNIKGITILPKDHILYEFYGGNSMMFNIHEGFVPVTYNFGEDGNLKINSSKGDSYEYKYIYSGDALTLISEEQTAVYSLYDYVYEAGNGVPTHTFYAAGDEMRLTGNTTLGWLLEKGFQTNMNLNQPIASCQVTDEIELSYQGAKLIVKVGNPYEDAIELRNCQVCYYRLDDTSGMLLKGDGAEIGVTSYDEIDFMYAPYEKTEDRLRYVGELSGIYVSDFQEYQGEMLALETDFHLEVIYEFENGILKCIEMENPALLYNGLHDNVDNSLLAQMEPTEFSGIIEVRDTILSKLKRAFADANIMVDINESTGEIVLGNDVLFGVDEYELTQIGQQYIDSFMGVYASIITSDEFANYISEVRFEGHTDSSGSYGYNLALSQKRADSVYNYCISSFNDSLNETQKAKLQEVATTIGYSSSDPVFDENGSENMDASRRVAIKFFINVDNVKDANVSSQTEASAQIDVTIQGHQSMGIDSESEKAYNLEELIQKLDDSSIIIMESTVESPFIWNLPISVDSFIECGWIPEDGEDILIEPGYMGCIMTKGDSFCYVYIHNGSEMIEAIGKCKVFGVIVSDVMNSYIALKGGIDLTSGIDEIMTIYGEPYELIEESEYRFLTYNDYQTIHFMVGPEKGIFYVAPGYSYDGANLFYELLNS